MERISQIKEPKEAYETERSFHKYEATDKIEKIENNIMITEKLSRSPSIPKNEK